MEESAEEMEDIKEVLLQEYISPELLEGADETMENTLLDKSQGIYKKAFEQFTHWMSKQNLQSYDESVLLSYFNELSEKIAPVSLWSKYSMIKAMLFKEKSLDIKEYNKLKAFIKEKHYGATVKKTKIFSTCEVKKFLDDAPDSTHLATKVALILGIIGACKRDELYNLTINDVRHEGSVLIFTIPETKTQAKRSFTVEDSYCETINKYIELRPPLVYHRNFFLTYRNGKCTGQVIGKNKLGSMAQDIAKWLKLPNANEYTGHSFRRTSAILKRPRKGRPSSKNR